MKMFDAGKTRMIGLPYGEKNYDDMLSRFHLISERYGRTDRQICYINIAHQHTALLTRDKNECHGNEICLPATEYLIILPSVF